jgi:hypothetical protein
MRAVILARLTNAVSGTLFLPVIHARVIVIRDSYGAIVTAQTNFKVFHYGFSVFPGRYKQSARGLGFVA